MAKQKKWTKNRCNTVGRTFCAAIIYVVVHLLIVMVRFRAKNLKIFQMYLGEDGYERATGSTANPTGD